jgi:hypothetical protein
MIAFTRNRLLVGPIDLLGQPDQKSFGPSDVAEPIRVFVLDYLAADKLRAVLEEPASISSISSTANMTRR